MYKIQEIANLLQGEIKGDREFEIKGLSPFFQAKEDELTFASDEKFLHKLEETKAKVIIVPDMPLPETKKIYIITKISPRELMPKLLAYFKKPIKKIEKPIENSAIIGTNVNIAPFVYIGHDVKIGNNVTIYPNVTINQGVIIGDDTIIYSNVTIREFCEIGKRNILQPGCVIGADGFGFVKINGNNTKIEQIGKVILEDDVEVGANTTIDRGTIGNTIIKKFTKLDNLIQIGHNVTIGENFLMASQSGVAGSTQIGNNVTIGGQVGIGGHIKIGNNILIAGKSAVIGNVNDNQVLSGNPLMSLKENLRLQATLKKLPEILKRIKKIEKSN